MSMLTTKDGTEIYYKDWGHGLARAAVAGWPRARALVGGFDAWRAAGLPLEPKA